MKGHIFGRGKTKKDAWIVRLKNRGMFPIMTILGKFGAHVDISEKERKCIAWVRKNINPHLYNSTSGGVSKCEVSMETRKKMSENAYLRQYSDSFKPMVRFAIGLGRTARYECRSEDNRDQFVIRDNDLWDGWTYGYWDAAGDCCEARNDWTEFAHVMVAQ